MKQLMLIFLALTVPLQAFAGIAFDANEFITEVAGTYTVPVGGAQDIEVTDSNGKAATTSKMTQAFENSLIVLSAKREDLGPTTVHVTLHSGKWNVKNEYYEFATEVSKYDAPLVGDWLQYVPSKYTTTCEVSFPPYAPGAVLHYKTMVDHRPSRTGDWTTFLERELRIRNNGGGRLEMTFSSFSGDNTAVKLELVKVTP
jgi:hypothetical protein